MKSMYIFLLCTSTMTMHVSAYTIMISGVQAKNPAERILPFGQESILTTKIATDVQKYLQGYHDIARHCVVRVYNSHYNLEHPYDHKNVVNTQGNDFYCMISAYFQEKNQLQVYLYTLPSSGTYQTVHSPTEVRLYQHAHENVFSLTKKYTDDIIQEFKKQPSSTFEWKHMSSIAHTALQGITVPAIVIECGLYDHYSTSAYALIIAHALHAMIKGVVACA